VKILVGCSGWSYSDWVDIFYPKELANEHSRWLIYYSHYFRTTEVNTTFYAIPPISVVRSWLSRVGEAAEFEFSLKMPSAITHDALQNGELGKAVETLKRFLPVIEEMRGAGRLGAVLMQLPPAMLCTTRNISLLASFLEELDTDSVSYAIEFRNRSWLDGSSALRNEVKDLLVSSRVANVTVDGPSMPPITDVTARHAYMRFHGNNSDIWFTGKGEEDRRINRYDYLYGRGELEAWVPRVRELSLFSEVTRVYFNNHGTAKAARNAMELMDMLHIPHPEKRMHVTEQFKLGSFT